MQRSDRAGKGQAEWGKRDRKDKKLMKTVKTLKLPA
jgi:hypothetical protein